MTNDELQKHVMSEIIKEKTKKQEEKETAEEPEPVTEVEVEDKHDRKEQLFSSNAYENLQSRPEKPKSVLNNSRLGSAKKIIG
jgi:hypothetical protein